MGGLRQRLRDEEGAEVDRLLYFLSIFIRKNSRKELNFLVVKELEVKVFKKYVYVGEERFGVSEPEGVRSNRWSRF